MKLAIKVVSVMILLALLSPVFLLKGCGTVVNGGACGGCPDTTAPSDATIEASGGLADASVSEGTYCVNRVVFTVKDSAGIPMNNICVELFTNGGIVLVGTQGQLCSDAGLAYSSYIRTRTDGGGTVTVDFVTGYLSCNGSTTDQSYSLWVQANSCAVGATASATYTVTCSTT